MKLLMLVFTEDSSISSSAVLSNVLSLVGTEVISMASAN